MDPEAETPLESETTGQTEAASQEEPADETQTQSPLDILDTPRPSSASPSHVSDQASMRAALISSVFRDELCVCKSHPLFQALDWDIGTPDDDLDDEVAGIMSAIKGS